MSLRLQSTRSGVFAFPIAVAQRGAEQTITPTPPGSAPQGIPPGQNKPKRARNGGRVPNPSESNSWEYQAGVRAASRFDPPFDELN